jgi:hypothetical protein
MESNSLPLNKPNYEEIKAQLKARIAEKSDFESREMVSNYIQAEFIFVKSLCDSKIVNRYIITPFFEADDPVMFQQYLMSFPNCTGFKSIDDTLNQLMMGYLVMFVKDQIFVFEARKFEASQVHEATVESIVQGPRDALNENIVSKNWDNTNEIHEWIEMYKNIEFEVSSSISLKDSGIIR